MKHDVKSIIECSTNYQWRGKPTKDDDGKMWYNDKQVYLGYNWVNIKIPYIDMFNRLSIDGLCISPKLKASNRKTEYFVSHQLALLDIDSGMTIDELRDNQWYNLFGSGFYTSPSHSEEHHKFRIIFRLEKPVVDVTDMVHLYLELMSLFETADRKCKDGARLFNGTINAAHKELTDRIIPAIVVQELIEGSKQHIKEQEEIYNKQIKIEYSNRCSDVVIDMLQGMYIGDYEVWRNIGWGLKAGGYSLNDFQYITSGMMSKKSSKAAEVVWRDGSTRGKACTMGTVVYHLKQHYGDDVLQQIKDQEKKLIIEKWSTK